MRIRWRLPLIFAFATLAFAGIVAVVSALILRGVFLEQLEDAMAEKARQYAATLQTTATYLADEGGESDTAPLEALQTLTSSVGAAADARFTLIDKNGIVLADSEADPSQLENHADRPEVARALAGNEGSERRYSTTLDLDLVYVAIPLPPAGTAWSEGVVRVAQPASRIDATLAASWRIPLITWTVLLLPILVVAYLLSRSMVTPVDRLRRMTAQVAAGDFASRNSVFRSDELGELADSLNSMAEQLQARDAQLRAELERSESVLTAMSEGVLLTDSEGRLLRSNPAAEQILGVDLSAAQGGAVVVVARAFPSQALVEKARVSGGPTSEILELPDGRSLAVEVIPLRAPDHQAGPSATASATLAEQTLFVIRDITSKREVERMRRDFVTNVSHELKTPLSGLSLLAQTLATAVGEDPTQAGRFVAQLSGEIERLIDLTDDLLTLSRLEEPMGASEVPFTSLDLAQLVAETVEDMHAAASAKDQELTHQVPADVTVEGDDSALRTMVRNLIDNAIRYTEPQGHISVELNTARDAQGQSWAVLSVADDGVGIPLTDQERIFERFYRVDKARSRQTGGTGLGLSIVRHAAERHGGSVEVESSLGLGSTFTVRLPSR